MSLEVNNPYDERLTFWTEKAINQLGISINLFTSIGIALIGYYNVGFHDIPKISFSVNSTFSKELFFYFLCFSPIVLSVLFGLLSVVSRLYDFRICRQILLTRKRVFSIKDQKINLEKIDYQYKPKYISVFFKYMKNVKLDITKEDIKTGAYQIKFVELSTDSKLLGRFTLITHRCQLLLLFISIIFYLTYKISI